MKVTKGKYSNTYLTYSCLYHTHILFIHSSDDTRAENTAERFRAMSSHKSILNKHIGILIEEICFGRKVIHIYTYIECSWKKADTHIAQCRSEACARLYVCETETVPKREIERDWMAFAINPHTVYINLDTSYTTHTHIYIILQFFLRHFVFFISAKNSIWWMPFQRAALSILAQPGFWLIIHLSSICYLQRMWYKTEDVHSHSSKVLISIGFFVQPFLISSTYHRRNWMWVAYIGYRRQRLGQVWWGGRAGALPRFRVIQRRQ